jgi:hypothetical protein
MFPPVTMALSLNISRRSDKHTRQHKHIQVTAPKFHFQISHAFPTQEWFNLARDDVLRFRRTPPCLLSLVGWLKRAGRSFNVALLHKRHEHLSNQRGGKSNEIWSDVDGTEAITNRDWTQLLDITTYPTWQCIDSTRRSAEENHSTSQTQTLSVGCVAIFMIDDVY